MKMFEFEKRWRFRYRDVSKLQGPEREMSKYFWRAALEEVMDRTVDFELIQWIKKELEN